MCDLQRIYKIVSIIDLKGLGFSHTGNGASSVYTAALTFAVAGSKLLDLVKKYNSLFAWFYPEVTPMSHLSSSQLACLL